MQIIFPKSEYFDGAKELGCIEYLKEAIESGYIRKFDQKTILNGAELLEKKYNFLKSKNKEQIFKKFVQEPEGGFFAMVLSEYLLEGVFCHPIYGGGRDFKGYKSIKMTPGKPEPKTRYGKKVERI
jgi:hypothetical protein